MIALHSPDQVVETGLLGYQPEKMPAKRACSIVRRSFSGPGWKQELKELRRFRAILRTMQQDFSALQTVWRSERGFDGMTARVGLVSGVRFGLAQRRVSMSSLPLVNRDRQRSLVRGTDMHITKMLCHAYFAGLPLSMHRAIRSETFASPTHMTVSAPPQ